jgi:hypothetical protein
VPAVCLIHHAAAGGLAGGDHGRERLFDGFGESLDLEHLGVRQSPFATYIGYRVKK